MTLLVKRKAGSITVFLSFILLFLLGLSGTIIEGARLLAVRNMENRSVKMAMETVLTKYYLPLYEEYHLFFMEMGLHTVDQEKEKLTETVKHYLMYTLLPGKEIDIFDTSYQIPNMDLYQITIDEMKIPEITRAVDYNGDILLNQGAEYMKYKSLDSILGQFVDGLKGITAIGKSSAVVKEKLEAEESLSELSKSIMDIMEAVEGISFGRKGLQYTRSGLIKTETAFAKRICPGEVSSNHVGINHELVWNSLKMHYMNPLTLINEMEQRIELIFAWEEEIEALEDEKKKRVLEKKINKEIKALETSKHTLLKVSKDTIKAIDKGLKFMPKLKIQQGEAEKKLNHYEEKLNESKSGMLDSVYKGLEEDLEGKKKYVGSDQTSMITSILNMKPVLEKNKKILEDILSLEDISLGWELTTLKNNLGNILVELKEYHIQELVFDYKSLVINPNVKNPLNGLKELIENGVMGLVINDTEKISPKTIENPDYLYKKYKKISSEFDKMDWDYGTLLLDMDKEGDKKGLSDSLGELGESVESTGKEKNGIHQWIKGILFNEYIGEHFLEFSQAEKEEEQGETKTRALEYEEEYVIGGKASDRNNLKEMINRLLFIRTTANFIYLLSDSEKGNLAYGTAAALVGFTGLEPAVQLTKTLILMAWAYEEAIVDTAALLEGKKVPLMKDKSNFIISFEELLILNKDLVQAKVEKMPENPDMVALSYEDYKRLFLLLEDNRKKSYRTMDLIQHNMQLSYEQDFSIERCIYGFDLEASFRIPSKFLNLPFTKGMIKDSSEGWNHTVKAACSY